MLTLTLRVGDQMDLGGDVRLTVLVGVSPPVEGVAEKGKPLRGAAPGSPLLAAQPTDRAAALALPNRDVLQRPKAGKLMARKYDPEKLSQAAAAWDVHHALVASVRRLVRIAGGVQAAKDVIDAVAAADVPGKDKDGRKASRAGRAVRGRRPSSPRTRTTTMSELRRGEGAGGGRRTKAGPRDGPRSGGSLEPDPGHPGGGPRAAARPGGRRRLPLGLGLPLGRPGAARGHVRPDGAGHHGRLPPPVRPPLVRDLHAGSSSSWPSSGRWPSRGRCSSGSAMHRRHHQHSDTPGRPALAAPPRRRRPRACCGASGTPTSAGSSSPTRRTWTATSRTSAQSRAAAGGERPVPAVGGPRPGDPGGPGRAADAELGGASGPG